MSITKLLKDSLTYGIFNTLNKLFLVLLVPIYTRLLTQSEFGSLDLLLAFAKILVLLWGLQIESGTARMFYEARDQGKEEQLVATACWSLWVVPLLGCLALILYRKPLAVYLFQGEQQAHWLILTALIVPLTVQFWHTVLLFRLRDEKARYIWFSLLNLGPAALIGLVLVWKFDLGVTGILVGQLSGLILALGASLWTMRFYLRPSISMAWLKQLLVYGVPLVPITVSIWGQTYGNRFFISSFLGLSSLGVYSLAVIVASLIMTVQQAFRLAWIPHSTWMMGQEGSEDFFRRMLNIYAWIMGSLFLAITLYAQELVGLFGPPEYRAAAPYVGFIVAAMVLQGASDILAIGNDIVKKTYWINVGTFAGMACNLLGLYLTISRFGLAAAAVWFAFGNLVMNVLLLWTSQRNHWIPYNYYRYAFLVMFLGGVAWWKFLFPGTPVISLPGLLLKAIMVVLVSVVLGFIFLDRRDRQQGLELLLYPLRLPRVG
jgi:O-antigen/teichoic acid export membrane protein